MFKTLSAPVMVQWEVTADCNHNCIHCYNYWRKEKPEQRLIAGYEQLYWKVVETLVEHRVFSVVITGGEPLLVIEQVFPFIKALTDSGIHVSMNSNLTLLNRAKMQLVIDAGVRSILISIPSADPVTCDRITGVAGSLGRTIRGISLAKESGLRLFTNMVVSRINKYQVDETARAVALLGLNHFAATRAADPSSGKGFTPYQLDLDEFRQMQADLEEVKKELGITVNSLEANPVCSYGGIVPGQGYKFCTAGKTTCTIGFDGAIRPCNRSDWVYGNVAVDGLIASWLQMDEWRSDAWIPESCSGCGVRSICGGGCKVDAITAHGDPKMVDPLCDMTAIPTRFPTVGQQEELPLKQTYQINKALQTRPEEFGAILFESPKNWTAVGPELAEMISVAKEVVTIEAMESALGANVSGTVKLLAKKRILL